jgi:hypothetical protein
MRRVVTALVLVSVVGALVACSSGSPTTTTGTPVPAAGTVVPAATSGAANPSGDILSPLPASTPVEAFPTDAASVPQAVLDDLAAHKPMLIFFYDPTTHVSAGQRTEINAVMKKYAGAIQLVSFDYTTGVPVGSSTATLPAEIDKAERMTGLLKIDTTPYIVFVNANGLITFRFAGFVDRGLIEREVMRATQ